MGRCSAAKLSLVQMHYCMHSGLNINVRRLHCPVGIARSKGARTDTFVTGIANLLQEGLKEVVIKPIRSALPILAPLHFYLCQGLVGERGMSLC